jgi:signal transduction histidine kinase
LSDPRILELCRLAECFREGCFEVDPCVAGNDEVARLAGFLGELGRTLNEGFEKGRLLARITEEINSGLLLDEVLDHVFDGFRPLIPYDRIGLSLLEDQGQTVRVRWERSELAGPPFPEGYNLALRDTSLDALLEKNNPRILNDLGAYLRERPESEATRYLVEAGIQASLTCPLRAMGHPVGFLFFSSCQAGVYRQAHVDLFAQIAGNVSIILEKARLYQEIAELNHLKDRLLSVTAHDLRSPLAFLKGYLDLLREGDMGELTPAQSEAVEKMRSTCRTMLALINDLLSLNAIASGQVRMNPRLEDPRLLLQECAAIGVMLATRKKLHLLLEAPDELPMVVCDREKLAQALNNLVSNAVKFSHPGTTVTVRAGTGQGEIWFEVADQGVGIPEHELGGLFSFLNRPSVRPTGGEMSTGLGLPIVRRILEAHGGSVRATSAPGQGSTFTLRLPLEGCLQPGVRLG